MTGSPIHPAREIGFSEHVAELDAARAATLVYRRDDPATGRSLYCYTSRCVYAQPVSVPISPMGARWSTRRRWQRTRARARRRAV